MKAQAVAIFAACILKSGGNGIGRFGRWG